MAPVSTTVVCGGRGCDGVESPGVAGGVKAGEMIEGTVSAAKSKLVRLEACSCGCSCGEYSGGKAGDDAPEGVSAGIL